MEEQDRELEVLGVAEGVEAVPVGVDAGADRPLDRQRGERGEADLGRVEGEDRLPVEGRGVEHEAGDARGQRRALHELADDRAAHRVPDQDQVPGAVGERVAGGGAEVAPLGQAHVVEAVGAGRGAEVLAIADQQRRQAGAVEGGGHPQARLRSAVDPVHDDRPGAGPARQPARPASARARRGSRPWRRAGRATGSGRRRRRRSRSRPSCPAPGSRRGRAGVGSPCRRPARARRRRSRGRPATRARRPPAVRCPRSARGRRGRWAGRATVASAGRGEWSGTSTAEEKCQAAAAPAARTRTARTSPARIARRRRDIECV